MRVSIPKHLRGKISRLMDEMETDDPTVANTHALNCYFQGEHRQASAPVAPTTTQQPLLADNDDDEFAAIADFSD